MSTSEDFDVVRAAREVAETYRTQGFDAAEAVSPFAASLLLATAGRGARTRAGDPSSIFDRAA